MAVLIEASDLQKRFGEIVAVDGISLRVQQGEVLGFLGPNGAGKSTTMKMLTGFLEPDAGSASIAGIDVLESPKLAKAKLGYLPEGAPCYGDMTARAFLAFIAEIRRCLRPGGHLLIAAPTRPARDGRPLAFPNLYWRLRAACYHVVPGLVRFYDVSTLPGLVGNQGLTVVECNGEPGRVSVLARA